MEMTLTRTAKRKTYTIGCLAIDGTYFATRWSLRGAT